MQNMFNLKKQAKSGKECLVERPQWTSATGQKS
jgi:hypothetical protein